MKIISNKKYNEWLKMEKEYCASITSNELLIKEANELLDELEIRDKNHNKTLSDYEQSMQNLKDINRDLGDSLEVTKRELKRLKTLLTKNKISYKKENK